MPDLPTVRSIRDGQNLLKEISALDDNGAITSVGRTLAKLPIDARLGRFLLAANENGQFEHALIIIAAISVGDCRIRPVDKRDKSDVAHKQFADSNSDLLFYLKLWHELNGDFMRFSRREKKEYCQQKFLSLQKILQWLDLKNQLEKQCTKLKLGNVRDDLNYKQLHCAFLVGFASLIGAKNKTGMYVGARGIKFKLHPRSGLRRTKPPFVVCLERFETSARYADIVAKVDPSWVAKSAPHLIKSSYSRPSWDAQRGKAFAFRTQRLFGVALGEPKRVPFSKIDARESRRLLIEYGLVRYDLEQCPTFLRQNRKTMQILRNFEHRLRRQLVPGEQALYDFYDSVVPADIATMTALEKWIERVPEQGARLRYVVSDEIERRLKAINREFPDTLRTRGFEFGVKYSFRPGDKADGLTVKVAHQLLSRLPGDAFDALCPGMVDEKIRMMVKVLPKSCRKKVAPLADFMNFVMDEIRVEPLVDTLRRCYFQRCGEELDTEALGSLNLPAYLVAHIEVFDSPRVEERGSPMDNEKLPGKRFYPDLAAAQISESEAQENQSRDDPIFTRWQVKELPLVKEVKIGKNNVHDYSAFLDYGKGVKLRHLRTEISANEAHRHGVARLAALANVGSKRKQTVADFDQRELLLMCSLLGINHSDLTEVRKAAFLSLIPLGNAPRSMAAFDLFIRENAAGADDLAQELGQGITGLIKQAYRIKKRLNNEVRPHWSNEFEHMERQLFYLFSAQAIGVTCLEWQTAYSRFLKGLERRIERLTLDPQKDRKKASAINDVFRAWGKLWEESSGRVCEVFSIYLDVEELHLKQFAPEIASNRKVQGKILLKQIEDKLGAQGLGS